MNKLNIALELASKNWYVFPIKAKVKTPPLVKWLDGSSKDPEVIKGWWAKWPEANVGINCGMSNLVVIDLDVGKNKDGIQEFKDLEKKHGILGDTCTASTPSNGVHYYTQGLTKSSISKLGPGVDIKSIGGYVLAPGSELKKGSYEWVEFKKPIKTPKWVEDFLPAEKKKLKNNEPVVELDQKHNLSWAVKFLTEDAKPAVENQSGDATTFDMLCILKDRGISPQKAEELVLKHYNSRCEPPWGVEDLQKKITNAYAYSDGSPGGQTAEANFEGVELPDGIKRPSVYNEWVWIYPLKRFLERGNTENFIDAKSFDSKFNYLSGSSSISREIFSRDDLMDKPEGICFEPESPEKIGEHYNLWRPSDIKPAKTISDVSWFKGHIMLMADNRKREYDLIMSWLAWCIQKPKEKLKFALLIQGIQGTGKSWLGLLMCKIIGVNNTMTPSNTELHGQFNKWAKKVQLCVINELMSFGKLELANKFKPLITDPTIRIEEKGLDLYTIKNNMNLLLLTNWGNAIPIESDDRRYLVIRSEMEVQSTAYYDMLFENLGKADQVLSFLMAYDLSAFKGHGHAPHTADKDAMRETNYDDFECHLLDLFNNSWPPFHNDLVTIQSIVEAVPDQYKRANKYTNSKVSVFLKKRKAENLGQHRLSETQRVNLWAVRKQKTYRDLSPKTRAGLYIKQLSNKEDAGKSAYTEMVAK